MVEGNTDIVLTDTERRQYRGWLEAALKSLPEYNGSEKAEQQLFQPLLAMDAFIKDKNNGQPSTELERGFARDAWPDNPSSLLIINDFLQAADDVYTRKLEEAHGYKAVLLLLKQGGGVVKHSPETFVQTDEGHIKNATTLNPQPVEFKTQPRLAMLIRHLKDEGIYTDDIIAHTCTRDRHMVRKLPYIVLQIPRLDKEIAVCDEVGESTFVSNKILGTDVWASLSKDQLKERPEVAAIALHNEEDWWNGIHQVLSGGRLPSQNEKVDVEAFSSRKQPLDVDLIKQSILAHHDETGKWPTANSDRVGYGPYKEKIQWGSLNSSLVKGTRGLPGNSSLAALNEEVSREHGLDYVNILKQEDLDISKIKESILAHHTATGTWPTLKSGDVLYGPYKGKTRWANLNGYLRTGARGLPGSSSLPALNEEVSRENGLDYVNHLKQEYLDISKIKESILAHHRETGAWPTQASGEVLHGPYKGKIKWARLEGNLRRGIRGLPANLSLAALNEEVSKEHGLGYFNRLKQEELDVSNIKASILAHHTATGTWPTADSGDVLYGPYKGKIEWANLESNLRTGGRGLPGNSSIPALNEEVSREHGLHYVNHLKQEDLDIALIRESILAHHRETGTWPTKTSGDVLYGPYKEKAQWAKLDDNLRAGSRGLPGNSSLAKLNEEVSREHGLDYIKGKHSAQVLSSRLAKKKNNDPDLP